MEESWRNRRKFCTIWYFNISMEAHGPFTSMIYLLKIRKKILITRGIYSLRWLMVSLVKLPGELHSPVLFKLVHTVNASKRSDIFMNPQMNSSIRPYLLLRLSPWSVNMSILSFCGRQFKKKHTRPRFTQKMKINRAKHGIWMDRRVGYSTRLGDNTSHAVAVLKVFHGSTDSSRYI